MKAAVVTDFMARTVTLKVEDGPTMSTPDRQPRRFRVTHLIVEARGPHIDWVLLTGPRLQSDGSETPERCTLSLELEDLQDAPDWVQKLARESLHGVREWSMEA